MVALLCEDLQGTAVAADGILIGIDPGGLIARAEQILKGPLLVITQTVVMRQLGKVLVDMMGVETFQSPSNLPMQSRPPCP